jgi:hypothetical protein
MRPRGNRSFTLEELHRMLWQQDKPAFLRLVQEGCTSARSFQRQFEQADRAMQAAWEPGA